MATVRDAQATKQRILEAAFSEFTEHGFDGARVDEIASRACANKALIYQHFGDKQHLFNHILECKMSALEEITLAPEALPEALGAVFDFYAANRWFVRLMQWESLNFGVNPVPNEDVRKRRLRQFLTAIEEGQRLGHVDQSLDPRHTMVSLMGLVGFWFSCPQAARMLAGGDPYTPAALKRRRAHVIDAARRLLEVR